VADLAHFAVADLAVAVADLAHLAVADLAVAVADLAHLAVAAVADLGYPAFAALAADLAADLAL